MSNQEKALELAQEIETLCDEIAAATTLAEAQAKGATIKTKILRLRALVMEME